MFHTHTRHSSGSRLPPLVNSGEGVPQCTTARGGISLHGRQPSGTQSLRYAPYLAPLPCAPLGRRRQRTQLTSPACACRSKPPPHRTPHHVTPRHTPRRATQDETTGQNMAKHDITCHDSKTARVSSEACRRKKSEANNVRGEEATHEPGAAERRGTSRRSCPLVAASHPPPAHPLQPQRLRCRAPT